MQSTKLQGDDSPLLRLYGDADTSLIRLVRSYRSTREIVEFTKELLIDESDIVPFERSGPKPLLARFEDRARRDAQLLKDIMSLKADGIDSIAIITKTAAESRQALESLQMQGCEALQLITKETVTYQNG